LSDINDFCVQNISSRFAWKILGLSLSLRASKKICKVMSYSTELEELLLEETVTVEEKKLVIFNDEVNTFDFVINSLMDVCKHEMMQAEQCTLIIHYKGKCAVKNGEFDTLEPMCSALLDRGLTAEIH